MQLPHVRQVFGPALFSLVATPVGQVFRPAIRFAVLGAFAVLALAACNPGRPPAQTTVAAPEALAPKGAISIPFVFSWKPVSAPDPIYRVRVTDAAERVLYEQDVRSTECPPSAELKNMMADHSTFTWTVSVLSEDTTQEVAKSAPLQFSLK